MASQNIEILRESPPTSIRICFRSLLCAALCCTLPILVTGCGRGGITSIANQRGVQELAPVASLGQSLPELGDSQSYPGALAYEVDLGIPDSEPGNNDRLMIYLPDKLPSEKIPCIFLAAAGATNFTGKKLSPGDLPEAIPYVYAGFAVVAYETDGELKENAETIGELRDAFLLHESSHAGLVNGLNAIEYALQKIPGIDADQLFAVGHSSAGRNALMLTAFDSRIKGCVTFAPATTISAADLQSLTTELAGMPSRFPQAIRQFLPSAHVAKINVPTLILHGTEDDVIPLASSQQFVSQLEKQGTEVTLRTQKNADHFNVLSGVSNAIPWLRMKAKITNRPIEIPMGSFPEEAKFVRTHLERATLFESRLTPALSSHPAATRFQFDFEVTDASYHESSNQLYVTGHPTGILAFEMESILQGDVGPSFAQLDWGQARRVAVNAADPAKVVFWRDDAVFESDSDLRRSKQLSIAWEPLTEQAERNSPRWKELAFVPDDPNLLHVRKYLSHYRVHLETEEVETVPAPDAGLSTTRLAFLQNFPRWRYHHGTETRQSATTAKFPEDAASASNLQRQLSLTAAVNGDPLSKSFWESPALLETFPTPLMEAKQAPSHLENVWWCGENVAVFVDEMSVGLQSIEGHRLISEKMEAARPFRAESTMRSIQEDRRSNYGGQRNQYVPPPELIATPTEPAALPASDAPERPVHPLQPDPDLPQRRTCYVFADTDDQRVLIVSQRDLLIFDLNKVPRPELKRAPELIEAQVGVPMSLPIQYEGELESVELEGASVLDQVHRVAADTTFTPAIADTGFKRMKWSANTSAGLETVHTIVHTSLPTKTIDQMEAIQLHARPDSERLVMWGRTPGESRWRVSLWQGDDAAPFELGFSQPVQRATFNATSLFVATASEEAGQKTTRIQRFEIGETNATAEVQFANEIDSLQVVGGKFLAAGQPLMTRDDANQRLALRFLVRLKASDLTEIEPALCDPLACLANTLEDGIIWDGTLWSGDPKRKTALVETPKTTWTPLNQLAGRTRIAGESLLVGENSSQHSVLLRPESLKDWPADQPLHATSRGVYRAGRLLEFFPHDSSNPTTRIDLDGPRSVYVHQLRQPVTRSMALTSSKIYVASGNRLFYLDRRLIEDSLPTPDLQIQPTQRKITLNVSSKETISFQAVGATRYHLHLTGAIESRDAWKSLESDDGAFEISAKEFLDSVKHEMGELAYLKKGNVPEQLDPTEAEFRDWIQAQQQTYLQVTGKRTRTIPVEMKALLIAENERGARDCFLHSYFLLVPLSEFP
ncbi:alpha/beta hydrolase family protein [Rhodopirellula islandica]|nr:prolyl oligopeptidase family serine peptidase [Rhodopirellula islandica]